MPRQPVKSSSSASKSGKTHPSYEKMIVKAIFEEGDKGGSKASAQAISKYILANYPDVSESTFKTHFRVALKRLVEQKKLIQKKGSYKLPKATVDKLQGKKSVKRGRSKSPSRSRSRSPSAKSPSRSRSKSPEPKSPVSKTKKTKEPKSPSKRTRSKSPSKKTPAESPKKRKTAASASPSPKKKAKTPEKKRPAPKKVGSYPTKPKPRTTQNSKNAGKEKPSRVQPARKKKSQAA